MKKIKLTQGKYALVVDEDFAKLNQFKWHTVKCGNTLYAAREVSDKTKKSGWRRVFMHRVVLGAEKGQLCDHIDRNGLNNQRSNLRIASRSVNGLNQRISKNNTSGFKGVVWDKSANKWQARIRIKNKQRHLGLFDTPKKAFTCYQQAYQKLLAELTKDT